MSALAPKICVCVWWGWGVCWVFGWVGALCFVWWINQSHLKVQGRSIDGHIHKCTHPADGDAVEVGHDIGNARPARGRLALDDHHRGGAGQGHGGEHRDEPHEAEAALPQQVAGVGELGLGQVLDADLEGGPQEADAEADERHHEPVVPLPRDPVLLEPALVDARVQRQVRDGGEGLGVVGVARSLGVGVVRGTGCVSAIGKSKHIFRPHTAHTP